MQPEPHAVVTVTLDGRPTTFAAPVRETLADSLRRRCHVRSVHLGCEHGVCGACTIVFDGETARSCLMFSAQADGHTVDTVESETDEPILAHLRDAFSRHHALQCGFCTPGFLTAAAELLGEHPEPERLNAGVVREALSGNLCRCTGYHNIVEAVLDAGRKVATTRERGEV